MSFTALLADSSSCCWPLTVGAPQLQSSAVFLPVTPVATLIPWLKIPPKGQWPACPRVLKKMVHLYAKQNSWFPTPLRKPVLTSHAHTQLMAAQFTSLLTPETQSYPWLFSLLILNTQSISRACHLYYPNISLICQPSRSYPQPLPQSKAPALFIWATIREWQASCFCFSGAIFCTNRSFKKNIRLQHHSPAFHT